MTSMQIELSTEEANELIKLMDAGVRQGGLQSAGIASAMLAKLQAASKQSEPVTTTPEREELQDASV